MTPFVRLARVGIAVALTFPLVLASPTAVAAKAGKAHKDSSSFIHGVLPPPPPGSTAPWNSAAEPAIRSDPGGAFYISSENGLGSGTDAWKSTNNGVTYSSLVQPNGVSEGGASQTTGLAPGGGDTDLATAPAANSKDGYNVYVASLTLGDVTVSASQDGGATWTSNELSATVGGDDREFIAATAADGFYLSYHAIATGNELIVNQGQLVDGIPTPVATYDAINPAQPNIYAPTIFGN